MFLKEAQLRFVKVFLQERLWKSREKWIGGKPFIGWWNQTSTAGF